MVSGASKHHSQASRQGRVLMSFLDNSEWQPSTSCEHPRTYQVLGPTFHTSVNKLKFETFVLS